MTSLREAAQQALTILEAWKHKCMWGDWDGVTDALRAALAEHDKKIVWVEERKAHWAEQLQLARENQERERQQREEAALAEPVQEPVAWMVYTLDGKSVCVTDNPADFTDEHRVLPLYTAPPQRKPLSEEEILRIKPVRPDLVDFRSGVRCAERAHGIGEHQ